MQYAQGFSIQYLTGYKLVTIRGGAGKAATRYALAPRSRRDTQKAILLSTHELDLALQAADRLALLTAQGALHLGTPEELVLDGTFAAAFAREGLAFDAATGTFSLHAA